MTEILGPDAYSQKEAAARVSAVGVVKARLPLLMVSLGQRDDLVQ